MLVHLVELVLDNALLQLLPLIVLLVSMDLVLLEHVLHVLLEQLLVQMLLLTVYVLMDILKLDKQLLVPNVPLPEPKHVLTQFLYLLIV